MSATYTKSKKTTTQRTQRTQGGTRPAEPTAEDIHRQQFPQQNSSTSTTSATSSTPSGSSTNRERIPHTPAETAARAARKAEKIARLAAEAAKQAQEEAARLAAEAAKQAQEEAERKAREESESQKQITQRERYLKDGFLAKLRNYNIYIMRGVALKEFMRDIQPYPVNNPIDYHHWRQIEEGIKQITTLDNCINVVEYDDGTLHILDGQHRQRSIRNLSDTDLFTKEVEIHLYRSDFPASENTVKLFNRFNTVKPFKIEHEITSAITEIGSRLRRDCKGFGDDAIKQTENLTARQPAMSMKQFSSCLEPVLKELGPGNYIISDIVKCINEINLEFCVLFDKEHPDRLFKSDPAKNIKKKEDMRRIQFYLNTELSKKQWTTKLVEKLRISSQ